jgi:hypothetical protein
VLSASVSINYLHTLIIDRSRLHWMKMVNQWKPGFLIKVSVHRIVSLDNTMLFIYAPFHSMNQCLVDEVSKRKAGAPTHLITAFLITVARRRTLGTVTAKQSEAQACKQNGIW